MGGTAWLQDYKITRTEEQGLQEQNKQQGLQEQEQGLQEQKLNKKLQFLQENGRNCLATPLNHLLHVVTLKSPFGEVTIKYVCTLRHKTWSKIFVIMENII